jgi:hypothetical protein
MAGQQRTIEAGAVRRAPSAPPRWRARALILALALATAACADEEASRPAGAADFRAHGDHFEIDRHDGAGWRPFFVRGVNLAIATPGRFPGELSATRADYLRWFDGIAAANANVLRLYTLHFPPFYEALREWNEAHPEHPLYLLQGIWLDEIEHCEVSEQHASGVTIGCDYITERSAQLEEEIAYAVDVVHGLADIPERKGKAYGRFRSDVSPWLMGLLPGHEMDGYQVRAANLRYAPYTTYQGRYLRMASGLPIEGWVARGLDLVITRCRERWGRDYPVGWSNWPALDPIHHPTEPATFAQDVVDCDFGKFESIGGHDRGLYVSYHVYPFNPEFIIYGADYVKTIDAKGKPNSYLGYLRDLKAHHPGVPVLVAELGIPSSVGVAHINETAYNHGGYDEQAQGAILVEQIEDVVSADLAGAVVFEWMDEWFKRTWMCTPTMLPGERGPLWHDVISPEESFGLIAFWPVPGLSREVDGRRDDWLGADNVATVAEQSEAALVAGAGGVAAGAALTGAWLAHDPAYLYLRLQHGAGASAPHGTATLDEHVVLVGLSTSEGATGDRRLQAVPELETAPDLGFELWLTLDRAEGAYLLQVDDAYDPTPRLNGGKASGGRPEPNDNGVFQLARHLIMNNAQYIAEGKAIIPEKRFFEGGRLRWGDATVDTLAQVFAGPGGVVEARLPWHALWVSDPSGRHVLFDDPATPGLDAAKTAGVRALVLLARRQPDGSLRVVDALPRAAWHPGTPLQASELPLWAWPTWEAVAAPERFKPAYDALRDLFASMEAP